MPAQNTLSSDESRYQGAIPDTFGVCPPEKGVYRLKQNVVVGPSRISHRARRFIHEWYPFRLDYRSIPGATAPGITQSSVSTELF